MKFYKLVNKIWVETADIDSTRLNCSNIDKLAYKLGYSRIYSTASRRLTYNFYYMADCAVVKSSVAVELYGRRNYYLETIGNLDATKNLYFSCSQEKFDSYTNAELTRIYELTKCEDCGDIIKTSRAIKVGRNHVFCTSCVGRHAHRCEICGHYYMKRTSLHQYTLVEFNNPINVCNRCLPSFTRNLVTCADCGGLTRSYRRLRGQTYCCGCYSSHDVPNLIASYHCGHMDIEKQFATTETPAVDALVCGAEIETECASEPRFVAYDVNEIMNKEKTLCKFEHDSSLHNGVEIIMQPCTPNWYYETAEKVQSLFKTLQDSGCDYKADGVATCGLHIHINRSFFKDYDYENRLCYLFQLLQDKIRIFSQRTRFNYCNFATGRTSWDNIFHQKLNQMQGHGSAINCSNRNTIEIRIFRGTTSYEMFMACVEFTRNLATLVRDITDIEKIEHTTFEDVVNYCENKFLNTYCQRLGLLGGGC